MDSSETENTQLSAQSDSDLVKKINDHVKESSDHLGNWIKEAQENYDFYAGHQWSDEDIAVLEEQGRPPTVFNTCAKYINIISGFELQNRQEGRFFPREQGDTGVNELLTGTAEWVRDNCDAEDEESEAFLDVLICGRGWTETRVDYEKDADGEILITQIDPLSMRYDPSSRKRNLVDARWIAHLKDLSKEEFKELWPNAEVSLTGHGEDYEAITEPHNADDAWEYAEESQRPHRNKSKPYRVIEYQWYEREPHYRVLDVNNQTLVSLDEKKFSLIKNNPEKLLALGIDPSTLNYIKQYKRVYKKAFVIGHTLLEKTNNPCNDFTYKSITGLYDRNKSYHYGIMRLMKDPQRWSNKWLSQIQHILNTNAKGGLHVEVGAFQNPQKAEDEWARPDSITYYNPGGLQKILPKEPAKYPDGLDRLLQYAINAINDVTGVNAEMMGQANRFQAGYLEVERKKSAVMAIAVFFDSLRRYRKDQSRLLAEMIRKYISDGRLVRINGEQGKQYVPLLKDQLTFKYDVIVDEAPTSVNAKERTFSVLSQLLPQILQAGIPIPPDLLDFSPLPESLIQKWKAYITNSQQGDEMAEKMKAMQLLQAELELQAKQIENEKSAAEVSELSTRSILNQAKASKEQAVAQDESAQAAQKLGLTREVEVEKMRQKEESMLREQQRKDLAMMLEQRRKNISDQLDRINNKNKGESKDVGDNSTR